MVHGDFDVQQGMFILPTAPDPISGISSVPGKTISLISFFYKIYEIGVCL
jgi:hypothetical protein